MKVARTLAVNVAQQSVQETTTTSPGSAATWRTWKAGKRKERLVLLTAVGVRSGWLPC